MEMDDPYDTSDLGQFVTRATTGGPSFQPYVQQQQQQHYPLSDLMTVQQLHNGFTPAQQHHYLHHSDMVLMDTGSTASQAYNCNGFDGGATRWPRQETLNLLEVRSRLDYKFKEATHKGPLWDQVARIMCEEYGYQRSGKKCREKFENLYKYYKKTKEGKAGKQDGKHYRFFRQLEALCGEHHPPLTSTATFPTQPTTNTIHHQHSALLLQSLRGCDHGALSNSPSFDDLSYDDNLNESMESNGSMSMRERRRWKAKIKEFIDLKMRTIMEKQDTLLEKIMITIESRENERMVRREEWRKQEVDRVEREHKFRARERAWIEARDLALISSLEKLCNNNNNGNHQWLQQEFTRLIQERKSMDSRFPQCGFLNEGLLEDIATKMSHLGNHRSAIVCKEKWDGLNKDDIQENGIIKDEGKNKRKENYYEEINYLNNHNSNNIHNNEGAIYLNQLSGFSNCDINEPRFQMNEGSSSSSSPFFHHSNDNVNVIGGVGLATRDNCLRFFPNDGVCNLAWESNNCGF